MMKEILKQLLPPLFIKLPRLLRNKLRHFSSIHEHKKNGDTIFILGNGPSLKEQLETSCDMLASFPCICVNQFATTDFYAKIKPCVYLLMDPGYFISAIISEEVKNMVDTLWKNLFEKTKWNMDLIISSKFRGNESLKQLKKNAYINILFCNTLDCSMYLNKKSMFRLFNENKLPVPAQTVINTAVYLPIFWRYKQIVLLGADTSWHENYRMDQKTNRLYMEDTHFYNIQKIPLPTKIHEEFQALSWALEHYQLLREYADYNSVSVYNASGKSWIDAFERKTLEEVKEMLGRSVE